MTKREELQARVDAFEMSIARIEQDLAARASTRQAMTAAYTAECEQFDAATVVMTQRLNDLRSDHLLVRDVATAVEQVLAPAPEPPLEPVPEE